MKHFQSYGGREEEVGVEEVGVMNAGREGGSCCWGSPS